MRKRALPVGDNVIYEVVVWPMLFSLIFADVKIRHPRIIQKAELKNRTLTSKFGS